MKTRRILSGVLAALLALPLCLASGCGGGGGGSGANSGSVGEDEYVYVAEYSKLDCEAEGIGSIFTVGDKAYFTSYGTIGQREPGEGDPQPGDPDYYEGMYDIWGETLYCLDVKTGESEKLDYYQPSGSEDENFNRSLNGFAVNADGSLWVCENIYSYETDDDGNYLSETQKYMLRRIETDGTESVSIDLAPYASDAEWFYVSGIATDGNGNVVVGIENTLAVFDGTGKPINKIQTSEYGVDGLSVGKGGTVFAKVWGDYGIELSPVDLSAGTLGDRIKLPNNVYNIYNGGGEYDIYFGNNMSLYGMNIGDAEPTKLLNWVDVDIYSESMSAFTATDDGTLMCFFTNWKEDKMEFQKAELKKMLKSEVPPTTTLTMAAMYMDYELLNEVIEFNKTNGKYRITVTDYSEFNTADDYSAGLTKLNAEIISGNVPDLLCASSEMPIQVYAKKGLIEDLYPYIDADTELGGRGALMENVLKTFETDGKLCEVPSSFYIYTVLSTPKLAGPEIGWTMDEFNAVLADYPDATAFAEMTSDSLLWLALLFGGSSYLDWETGECRFDSDDYIKLLELAATYPAEINYDENYEYVSDIEMIRQGKAIATYMSLSSFEDYSMYKAAFGGEIAFKGFPNSYNNGSAFVSGGSSVCISSKCADKDGAWQFVRRMLTEDYQNEHIWWGFPTNKVCFEKKLSTAMEPDMGYDDEGNWVEWPKGSWGFGDGTEIEYYAMAQEDADEFLGFMDTVTSSMRFDQKVMDIVRECAAPFFAGQKSAADTAAVTQSRVSLYVSEQR